MALPSYVGRYAIRHEIARGGFATVILAWDEELDSAVALKILDPAHGNGDGELATRFIEEARLLRRIRSHHVVTVHDVGRLNDGRPYFVMDLADRGTLADWLAHQPANRADDVPGRTRELAAFADALADGLGAIHRAGVVHRDIKPANILFQSTRPLRDTDETVVHPASVGPLAPPDGDVFEDSRILVGDLGIAKDLLQGGPAATLVGGTPAYQAPEQLDPQQPVTAAADIYAATAVLFQLIAGAKPPRPDRLEEALRRVPGRWQGVVRQGLALDPGERFASMEAWQAAVQDVLAEEAADTSAATHGAAHELATGPVSADCPYKGLGAYQPQDADRFFGREALTEELVRRIQMQNVLVVGGPSGSGKSSLVRAGLIPALKDGAVTNSESWRIALMTPGRDAMTELFFQLARSLPSESPAVGVGDLTARPALARRLAHPTGSEPLLVLCIDQFEELFTLSPASQRDAFVEALASMTDPADSRVLVVLAVRADYYATCAQVPWLAERITANQVLVGPMSAAELRRAITEPGRHAGLYIERNLVDAIVDSAGNEPGSLPLVAHALVETWMRRKGATLTLEGYRAAGGVAGAIAQTADAIFEERFTEAEQAATHRLFLRLVTPGEGAGDTRRIVGRDEIEADQTPEVTRRVVDRLTEARLLTVDKQHVQIAHEALLRSWPRLRGWIDDARDDLRLRQRLVRHAEEWEAASRDPDLLLRGTPLLSAIEWQSKNPDQGGALVQGFIETSSLERDRAEAADRERRRRARRVRTMAVLALSLLAFGATVASVFAYLGYREAQRNAVRAAAASDQADARFALALGAVGAGLVEDDPRLALYLGGEAAARAGEEPPGYDARSAMVAARRELAGVGPHLLGSPIPVGDALSMAISPNGAFIAVGGRDGSIAIIDTASRQPVGAPIAGHEGGVEDLEFSPSGRLLASAGNDGTVRLWPAGGGLLGAGEVVAELSDIAWGLDFDPTGERLATASEDQTVRVLPTASPGTPGKPVAEGIGDALTVAFSADGKALLAGTGTGAIYGWRLPGGEPMMTPITGVHTSDVWELHFAPTNDHFATVSSDGTSALFAYPGARYLGRAFAADDLIRSVLFTPDGTALVGGSESGRLRVWRLEPPGPLAASAVGHTSRISEIALRGDGRLAASLGRDHAVRLWTLFDPVPMAIEHSLANGAAKAVAVSADGADVAAAGETGIIHLWRADAHEPQLFAGHAREVWALAMSPDKRTLASGDRSGEVRLWDIASGALKSAGNAGGGAVWWLGFTPDGKRLVAAADGGIDILDAASGNRIDGLPQKIGQATRAAISPDGTLLAATTTDGRVRLFDLAASSHLRDFDVVGDVVWSAAFSPDGRLLAVASSDEVVSIWEVAAGERRVDLAGHDGGATDLAFLSGGASLAVVDRRGGLHLWDVPSRRRLIAPVAAHDGASWRLAAAPEKNVFVTVGDDGKVKAWDILSIERACEIGAAAFDRERRREYFGDAQHSLACGGG